MNDSTSFVPILGIVVGLVLAAACLVLAGVILNDFSRHGRPLLWRLFSGRAKAQWFVEHGYPMPDGWHLCEHCNRRVVELRWTYCFLCDEVMSMGMGDVM
jgi:hypothetical protein